MILSLENDRSAVATVIDKVINNTHAITSFGIDTCSLALTSILYTSNTVTVDSSSSCLRNCRQNELTSDTRSLLRSSL